MKFKLTQSELSVWHSRVRYILMTALKAHGSKGLDPVDKLPIYREIATLCWGGYPNLNELAVLFTNLNEVRFSGYARGSVADHRQLIIALLELAIANLGRPQKAQDLFCALHSTFCYKGKLDLVMLQNLLVELRSDLPGLTTSLSTTDK